MKGKSPTCTVRKPKPGVYRRLDEKAKVEEDDLDNYIPIRITTGVFINGV